MTRWPAAFFVAIALTVNTAVAEVVRVEIESREDVLDGRPYGRTGPYEKIVGKVYFAFDPSNPMNARIVDLDKAPRNAEGLVEAWANFMALRPKRPVPGGGVALLEVSNRGGKASLSYFNGAARSLDPSDAEHFGDGLLMRPGLTVAWVGWQFDVPLREGLLRLHVPAAVGEGGAPLASKATAWWRTAPTSSCRRASRRERSMSWSTAPKTLRSWA